MHNRGLRPYLSACRPEGYEPLRGQIVALMRERGVEVGDGELLITHGAQQALDLLARLFAEGVRRLAAALRAS